MVLLPTTALHYNSRLLNFVNLVESQGRLSCWSELSDLLYSEVPGVDLAVLRD